MPSNVVHYYFAGEVKKQLNDEIVRIIEDNRDAYYLGAQGPDILFYLKFKEEPTLLGEHIHKSADVFPMFEQSALYLRKQNSETLFAFMFGQLCHYASDRVIHPYVYFLEKKLLEYYPEEAHKHIHVLIESAFDYLCIRDCMKKNTASFKSTDTIRIGRAELKTVASYYSEFIAPLFGEKLEQSTAAKTVKRMRLFFKLCNDRTGIKYHIIRLVERLIGAPQAVSLFVRPRRERTNEDWFNHNRTPFPKYHNQEVMTEETFEELLARARADALSLIDNFYACLKGTAQLERLLYKLNYSG